MNELVEKAKKIKLLISDVDGVLTSGHLYLNEDAEPIKPFHVHDGFGLKLLLLSGLHVGIITTSNTPIISTRMSSLGVEHVYLNQINKKSAYEDLLNKLKLSDEQVAYIGDDLPDLSLIRRCGLGVAVANAVPLVREHADWTTEKIGGQGAVRELCDLIMHAQDSMQIALDKYLIDDA